MLKIYIKSFLVFAVASVVLGIGVQLILAQDSYSVAKGGGLQEIDAWGECRIVTNNHASHDIFVPVRTEREWLDFRINAPNITLADCGASCEGKTAGYYYTAKYDGYYYCGLAGRMWSPTPDIGTVVWDEYQSFCGNWDLYGYDDWETVRTGHLRNDFGVSACACRGWTYCGGEIPFTCGGESVCNLSTHCGGWDPHGSTRLYHGLRGDGRRIHTSFTWTISAYTPGSHRDYGVGWKRGVRCVRG